MKRKFSVLFVIVVIVFGLVGCLEKTEIMINFDSNGGSEVTSIITIDGKTIQFPDNPTKDGYVFDGWYLDNNIFSNAFTASSLLDNEKISNITVYAKWVSEEDYRPIGSVRVTFNSMGADNIAPIFVEPGSTISSPTIMREGYTLEGWYTSVNSGITLDERWSFVNNVVNSDFTLYAKWVANEYTLTFNSNGGSSIDSVTRTFNSELGDLNAPVRIGYTFVGWFSDPEFASEFILENMPSNNMTLYAKWSKNTYKITFIDFDSQLLQESTVDFDSDLSTFVYPEAAREGYTFIGWDRTLPKKMPNNDILFRAIYSVNHYSVSFQTNGGNYLAPLMIDYGRNISLPNSPIKEGYTFKGWFIDSELETTFTLSTMPAEDFQLYAKWEINHYSIHYLDYDGKLLNIFTFEYDSSLEDINFSLPFREGFTFIGWDIELPNKMPSNNLMLKATYAINKYTVTFETNGGSEIDPITQEFGTEIIIQNNSTKLGYTFGGWYLDENFSKAFTTDNNALTDDITVYAKWNINTYTLLFADFDGTVLKDIELGYNSDLRDILPPSSPSRIGYSFTNWDSDLPETMPAENLTIVAVYRINSYTIEFDANGGSNIESITQHYGTDITEPAQPIREGYSFVGWYQENELGEVYEFNTIPAENVRLVAKWLINSYTISLVLNGGTGNGEIVTEFNTIVDNSLPIKEGYTFKGWFLDSNFKLEYVFSTMPAYDFILYAKWEINAYQITFNTHGGNTLNPITLVFQTTIPVFSSSLREGYTFGGWYLDEEFLQPFGYDYMPAKDITLHALWLNSIIFHANGGTVVSTITLLSGSSVTQPSNPSKLGHTFIGWFSNSELTIPYTFDVMPELNIAIYAKWSVNNYIISFDSNGGSFIESIEQSFGTDIDFPTPVRAGYTFVRWFRDSDLTQPVNINTVQASNLTLYASWELTVFTIFYNLDDGVNSEINPSFYTVYDSNIILESPTKIGYTFEGWYEAEDFSGSRAYFIAINRLEDITLHAKWRINQYTVDYYVFSPDFDPFYHIPLYGDEIIIQLSSGALYSSILTSTGRVFTWGNNSSGQLGDNTTKSRGTPVDISNRFNLNLDESIIQLSLGNGHSAALTSTGRVFTWGSNYYGQLGDSTTTSRRTPVDISNRFNLNLDESIIQLSLGQSHSAALTSTGRVFTWGSNDSGQLGDNTTTRRRTPVDISNRFNLNLDESIIQLSLGESHSAALTSTGRVFTWGFNSYGQLGDNTTTSRGTPVDISNRFNLNLDESIIQLSLGSRHSAALTSTGRVFTWGSNSSGQLGDNTTIIRLIPVDISYHFNLNLDESIIQLSLGQFHSAALTSTGRVFTWGSNGSGQLGDNTTTSRGTPVDISNRFNLNLDESIIQLSLGNGHSAALTSTGRVFTWGSNSYGQLGNASSVSRSNPIVIPYFYKPLLVMSDRIVYNMDIEYYLPVLEGSTFSGWFNDVMFKEKNDFVSMPSQNIILHGKWMNTIFFEVNGGSEVDKITQDKATSIQIPNNPVKEGYVFAGWFSDESLITHYNFYIMPSENLKLYAKWNPNLYTVVYVLNDGSSDIMNTAYAGSELYIPTRVGYNFMGWYLDEELLNKYNIDTFPIFDVVLFAKWISE